jgi:hypothetical protein
MPRDGAAAGLNTRHHRELRGDRRGQTLHRKAAIVAKDKSTKSKSTKPTVTDDDFAKPSEAPAGGEGWQFATEDNLGDLFLITPLRIDEIDDKFKPGERKEIIVADVVALNTKKPEKSEEHENVWIFQGYLKGSLRGYVGTRRVLGRLGKGETKDRGNYPWILEDADADDVKVAKAYLASLDPFAQKGAKADAADEKPAKKGKKKK